MAEGRLGNYIQLMRFKHCIKNLLILLPLVFNGSFFDVPKLEDAILGFLSFTFLAASVYVLNDIQDVDKDRLHPKKRFRPIASGAVSIAEGKVLGAVSFVIAMILNFFTGGGYCLLRMAPAVLHSERRV